MKCLEKDPRHRYPTALALAEDLERFIVGKDPLAPRQTRLRRAKRWMGRNQWTISGAVGILAVAITIGVGVAMAPVRQQQTPIVVNPLEEMQKDLVAGRSVELIPTAGRPRWHRWLLGSPELIAEPGEPCQFESISYGLLELCPDPMVEHYVIRAKMQFKESKLGPGGLPGSVTTGFYFGQSAVAGSDNRRALAMIGVHFDDMLPRPPPPPAKLPDNVVRMQAARLLFEPNVDPKSGLIGFPRAWTPISRTLPLGIWNYRAAIAVKDVTLTPLP